MLRTPYLLFLGDATDPGDAKTAFGLRDWCDGAALLGQLRLSGCTVSTGLPDMDVAGAAAAGAGSLVVGVAPVGGRIPPDWHPILVHATAAGLDIVSGMHDRLSTVPGLVESALRHNVVLHDVRHSDRQFPAGTGRKRAGLRLLTVGTDCALGKKYTALALARALRKAGIAATFRATGQTGIMIAGSGIAIDAVVADFIAGAAEALSPPAEPDHWDIIEGQGSLLHPAYAGVSLGLLHGSQPDAVILCHDPARKRLLGFPEYPVPGIAEAIDAVLRAGRLTNPAIQCIGISINSSGIAASDRDALFRHLESAFDLPVLDPLRDPLEPLVDRMAAMAAR